MRASENQHWRQAVKVSIQRTDERVGDVKVARVYSERLKHAGNILHHIASRVGLSALTQCAIDSGANQNQPIRLWMAVITQPLRRRQTQPSARRVADHGHSLCANRLNEPPQPPPNRRLHVFRNPTRSQPIEWDDAVRIRLLYQLTTKPPMATNNLVKIGAAVQEDHVMSSTTVSGGLDVVYRPALRETQINIDVAP